MERHTVFFDGDMNMLILGKIIRFNEILMIIFEGKFVTVTLNSSGNT